MSTHSYTAKSLLFLTLLLQTACSISKLSFEREAAEYEETLDNVLESLKKDFQNIEAIEIGAIEREELEKVRKKAEEASETARKVRQEVRDAQKQMDGNEFKAFIDKVNAKFPDLANKVNEMEKLTDEKSKEIYDLPDCPEKYAKIIKLQEMNIEAARALLNLVEAGKVEPAVENT